MLLPCLFAAAHVPTATEPTATETDHLKYVARPLLGRIVDE